jgi:hypothetical protein
MYVNMTLVQYYLNSTEEPNNSTSNETRIISKEEQLANILKSDIKREKQAKLIAIKLKAQELEDEIRMNETLHNMTLQDAKDEIRRAKGKLELERKVNETELLEAERMANITREEEAREKVEEETLAQKLIDDAKWMKRVEEQEKNGGHPPTSTNTTAPISKRRKCNNTFFFTS